MGFDSRKSFEVIMHTPTPPVCQENVRWFILLDMILIMGYQWIVHYTAIHTKCLGCLHKCTNAVTPWWGLSAINLSKPDPYLQLTGQDNEQKYQQVWLGWFLCCPLWCKRTLSVEFANYGKYEYDKWCLGLCRKKSRLKIWKKIEIEIGKWWYIHKWIYSSLICCFH